MQEATDVRVNKPENRRRPKERVRPTHPAPDTSRLRQRTLRFVGAAGMAGLMLLMTTAPASASGVTPWKYLRCNSGLYVTVQTLTTVDAVVEIATFGEKRGPWGNYWKRNTFNTRISYGYWRASTSGSMNYAETYAYCSPY